jgi:hypothetical protein
VISTVKVKTGMNQPLIHQLAEIFPNIDPVDRTSINAWEDDNFVAAVRATGRKKLIMAALWTEVCLVLPALDAMRAGYEVTRWWMPSQVHRRRRTALAWSARSPSMPRVISTRCQGCIISPSQRSRSGGSHPTRPAVWDQAVFEARAKSEVLWTITAGATAIGGRSYAKSIP